MELKTENIQKKGAKLKILFGVVVATVLFSLLPFVLITKLIGRPLAQGLSVYVIIFISNFAIFYPITMLIYTHRKKSRNRNNRTTA